MSALLAKSPIFLGERKFFLGEFCKVLTFSSLSASIGEDGGEWAGGLRFGGDGVGGRRSDVGFGGGGGEVLVEHISSSDVDDERQTSPLST